MKTIVIIGAGFAGIYTTKRLLKKIKKKPLKIILISEHNYFLFTPMLHEVATGGISRDNIIASVNQIINHCHFTFVKGKVSNIDTKKKCVDIGHCDIKYDVLILATGSSANYHGIKGAEKNTIALRNLQSSYAIKNKIIGQIERAVLEKDQKKRKKLLTFMVVGGGATGVELAGELAEFLKTILHTDHKCIKEKDLKILLVHRGDHILNMLPNYFSKKCQEQLTKEGVTLMLKTDVKEVGDGFIKDQRGGKHEAGAIFWAVGFKPNIVPLDKKSVKVYHVSHHFHLEDTRFKHEKIFDDIFALGDCAYIAQEDGRRVPMLAQVAVEQSKYVAHNVMHRLGYAKELRAYSFKLKGFLLSVGQYFAVAHMKLFEKDLYFSGFWAWFLWRTIYMTKLVGFGNKLRVATDWTLNFFYPRDTAETNE
jgi:NADH:ubiquinone reductase (H+-translocating)